MPTTAPELVGQTRMPSPAARNAPWVRRAGDVASADPARPSFTCHTRLGYWLSTVTSTAGETSSRTEVIATFSNRVGSRHRTRTYPACSIGTYSRPLIGSGGARNTASRHSRNALVVWSASSSDRRLNVVRVFLVVATRPRTQACRPVGISVATSWPVLIAASRTSGVPEAFGSGMPPKFGFGATGGGGRAMSST